MIHEIFFGKKNSFNLFVMERSKDEILDRFWDITIGYFYIEAEVSLCCIQGVVTSIFLQTGWWFQPTWKISVKLEIFPK